VVALSDAVLSPVRPTFFDFMATNTFAAFVSRLQAMQPDTRFMMFINEKHSSRTDDKNARELLAAKVAKQRNVVVLETEIPDAAVISSFGGRGETIFEYSPKSPAARQYKKLVKEVVGCLVPVEATA
jgi:cellulose biosynthesis protein BcsQ